jgi:HEPN domain
MPRNTGQTVALSILEAVAHKHQAEEYLRAALYSLSVGDFNAAAGASVDAGTNAADAVAGINLGQRWKGPHDQAADFVAKALPEGREIARELRRLLPLKTQAHYEATTVSEAKARSAVAAAERAVAAAHRATART